MFVHTHTVCSSKWDGIFFSRFFFSSVLSNFLFSFYFHLLTSYHKNLNDCLYKGSPYFSIIFPSSFSFSLIIHIWTKSCDCLSFSPYFCLYMKYTHGHNLMYAIYLIRSGVDIILKVSRFLTGLDPKEMKKERKR